MDEWNLQSSEKCTSAYLFQIAQNKPYNYLLMICMQKFHLYCTNFNYLYQFHLSVLCLGCDVLSANQHAEILHA